MNFKNLLGNDKIKQELLDVVRSGNVSHSYMFVGEEGLGKCLFALDFAKLILCMSENKPECNDCESCVKFLSQNHPDFIKVEPDGNSIKIAQMREMQENIYQKPIVSSKKVFIINNAEKMTQEAQNSLLKTLEEPPSYIVIILIVSNENLLLNTIKSRCLKLNFQNIGKAEILKYLEANNLKQEFTDNMVNLCNGSIGKLEEIRQNIELYRNTENIIINILNARYDSVIDVIKDSELLYKSKEKITNMLEYMEVIAYTYIQKNISYTEVINTIENTRNKLYTNCNYDMCIDELLIKIWEEINEKHSRS